MFTIIVVVIKSIYDFKIWVNKWLVNWVDFGSPFFCITLEKILGRRMTVNSVWPYENKLNINVVGMRYMLYLCTTKTNKCIMSRILRMFDHSTKLYVRVQLSEDKEYYEKWVSKNKRNWRLVDTMKSLDDVMSTQQELIDNNYKSLFDKITSTSV